MPSEAQASAPAPAGSGTGITSVGQAQMPCGALSTSNAIGQAGGEGRSGAMELKHSFRSTGHPALPDHLRLKQMIVICRHGDRAPVSRNLGTLLQDGPESASLWTSKLPDTADIDRWSNAFPPRVLGDNCGQTIEEMVGAEGPWGQLTIRGAEELKVVGERLRGVLDGRSGVGERALFPVGLEAEKSSIFVRSSHLTRTQQSAQNLLFGLGLKDGVDIHVRPSERETLWPHTRRSGSRQAEIIAQANKDNHWPGQEELLTETAKMVGMDEASLKWTTAREVLSCYEAHDVPLPPGAISSGVVQGVLDFTGWMWGRWFSSREMARLSLGPLLAEILAVMGLRGGDKGIPEAGIEDRPKLAIFSGHDSTLVPILCALRIYNDGWPPYSSYVSLDVAEDEDGARAVRVVYNGNEALLPGASGPWMPVAELRERLDDVMPGVGDAQLSSGGGSKPAAGELAAAVGGNGNDD